MNSQFNRIIGLTLIAIAAAGCGQADVTVAEPPRPVVVQAPTSPPSIEVSRDQPAAAPATARPAPTVAATPVPLDELGLQLEPVAAGFEHPIYLTHAGDGSGRLFVVEQPGRIRIIRTGAIDPTPFLDITPLVGSKGLEQGLLSVAFHPQYSTNGYFFVNYTNTAGDTVIARYQVSPTNPQAADPASAKILLTIDQPYANHNGGHLLFGPDGYLYAGMGDGGSANDPENRAQNLGSLLGKILRLDVDRADPYGVPPTNPFIDQTSARPEIWAYGLRNPWRIAFDPLTGDLYIGDVGQNNYEEVDVALAGAAGGQNYGWRVTEGLHCNIPQNCDAAALGATPPVAEYDHTQGCSVTGGYVYRGSRSPALTGIYFYSDYCSGTIWGLRYLGQWENAKLLESGRRVSSFGQDESGEIYVVDIGGEVLALR
jgi:glucose/arabinose dehydrogenase